ncbi:MAG: type IV pilus secretin PilQ [Luteitalea sp.]|nr:type IV pilus secretin PilQ [Luteitalea sp.]
MASSRCPAPTIRIPRRGRPRSTSKARTSHYAGFSERSRRMQAWTSWSSRYRLRRARVDTRGSARHVCLRACAYQSEVRRDRRPRARARRHRHDRRRAREASTANTAYRWPRARPVRAALRANQRALCVSAHARRRDAPFRGCARWSRADRRRVHGCASSGRHSLAERPGLGGRGRRSSARCAGRARHVRRGDVRTVRGCACVPRSLEIPPATACLAVAPRRRTYLAVPQRRRRGGQMTRPIHAVALTALLVGWSGEGWPVAQVPPETSMPRLPRPKEVKAAPAVTLDFQQVDLRAALRALAALADLSLVLDPGIEGSVDVTLRDVAWDQALDVILRAHRLGAQHDAGVLRVAPLGVLASEAAERRKRLEEQQREQALSHKTFRTITLSYARARALASLVKKAGLTRFGEVEIDEPTNTLILTDLPEGLDRAAKLIDALDIAQPQVEIQARIVQTTRDFTRELGVRLGLSAEASTRLGNTLPLVFPNSAALTGRYGVGSGEARDQAQLSLGSVDGALRLDLALSALEQMGKARVLSAPRVTTQNNVEAEVQQGTQIPYVTQATPVGGQADAPILAALLPPTVQFKDASLKLNVTPQITAADTIVMRVELERSAPDFASIVPGNPNPPISTSKALATIQVSDGATAVIGGVMVRSETTSQRRTPGLHRLPLLGWLFRDRVKDHSDQELLLFITPRILPGTVDGDSSAPDDKE